MGDGTGGERTTGPGDRQTPAVSPGNASSGRRERIAGTLLSSVVVDPEDVRGWFGRYLEAYAACGRGESATESLLDWYALPFLVTTDAGFAALPTADQVVGAVQPQIDGMLAGRFARTDVEAEDVSVLNATSALVRGTFSHRDRDGREIRRLTVTYLVTDGAAGRRISVLAVER
jgi:hypothetical protein